VPTFDEPVFASTTNALNTLIKDVVEAEPPTVITSSAKS